MLLCCTSILFLVPCFVALEMRVYWFFVLMLALVATSICYHGKIGNVSVCRWIDTCYASTLAIVFTCMALYMTQYNSIFLYAGCSGLMAIITYILSKLFAYTNILHMLVHMFGSLGFTLFVIALGKSVSSD